MHSFFQLSDRQSILTAPELAILKALKPLDQNSQVLFNLIPVQSYLANRTFLEKHLRKRWEYSLIDVGYTSDGDWLQSQTDTLANEGRDGWELVSVVLLETKEIGPDVRTRAFLAHSVAMYFKREVKQ